MADRSKTNRKRLLGVGMAVAFLMTVGFWQMNATTGNANPGRKGPIFDIIPDSSNPVIPTSAAAGSTFVLTGKVYPYRSVNQATCALLCDPTKDEPPCQIGTWTATVVVTPTITTTNSLL